MSERRESESKPRDLQPPCTYCGKRPPYKTGKNLSGPHHKTTCIGYWPRHAKRIL